MARKKVASEPVLRDWTAVDAALRDLKECQYALTELGVELDRRIDGLKDDYNKNAQPLQNRIKRLEGDVKEYVDAHRAELDGKSRTLVFGKVGYRASSKLMLAPAKVTEAIAALKAVPFPVSWTVKMKKKQKETQDILSYHTQAAGCSDKARAKASGGRQPIEECGRTGL